MIALNGAQKIIVKLAAPPATNQLPIVASFYDFRTDGSNTQPSEGSATLYTSGLNFVDAVASPSSYQFVRGVKYISIENADTVDATVYVYLLNGSPFLIGSWTLAPGSTLSYDEGNSWSVIDSTGSVVISGTVFVSNMIPAVETGLAKEATLSLVPTALGAQADAAAGTDTGTFSYISLFKRFLQRATTIITTLTDGTQKTQVTLINGVVSTSNSTTANLGVAGVFTGAWEDTRDYGIIYVSMKSNVVSAASGFVIEFSDDGVTSRGSTDSYTIAANTLKEFSFNPGVRYFRVVYTNGGTGTTTFFIQSLLKINGLPNSHRVNEAIGDEYDAQLVKSVLTAKRQDGTYGNIRSNNNDRLFTTNDSAYAEDSAHASGETGTFILGVRNDANTSRTTTDGDYSPLSTDAAGRLKVVEASTGSWANGVETTVTGTATLVQAANTSRKRLIIQNTGAADVRVGIAAVTTTTGVRLARGETMILEPPYVETDAIYAIREGAVSSTLLTQETT